MKVLPNTPITVKLEIILKMFTCLVLIVLLVKTQALDYIFTMEDEGAVPCPGHEDLFLDTYFDSTNIEWNYIDDETIMLQGYVIFLKQLDPILHFTLHIQKLNSGRWIETGLSINRPHVCQTFYGSSEIWYDFVKEFEFNSKLCPPPPGTKYEFNKKKVSTLLKNLSLAMQGHYRAIIKILDSEKLVFCMIVNGDIEKKA